MKTLLIGVGAAGNKAVMTAIDTGICKAENCIMVNSTSKDFPKEFNGEKIILSPNNTGCGKERSVAKDYTLTALKAGKFNVNDIRKIILTYFNVSKKEIIIGIISLLNMIMHKKLMIVTHLLSNCICFFLECIYVRPLYLFIIIS